MRGTQFRAAAGAEHIRIIPAHAGNSRQGRQHGADDTDHPRACGELSSTEIRPVLPFGSSPRMRGTRPRLLLRPDRALDHPPRMRGTPHCREYRRWRTRIIPAHAGNSRALSLVPDHPRACGELLVSEAQDERQFGSSPRMRGTRRCGREDDLVRRIIPAHAGNSRTDW